MDKIHFQKCTSRALIFCRFASIHISTTAQVNTALGIHKSSIASVSSLCTLHIQEQKMDDEE